MCISQRRHPLSLVVIGGLSSFFLGQWHWLYRPLYTLSWLLPFATKESVKKKIRERGREEERREEKSGEREKEKERKKTKRSRGVNLAGGKRNETLQCFSYRLRLQGRASSWWPLTDMGPGWQISFSAWMAREEPMCALLVIQVMCFICFPWDGKNYATYSRGAWNDWWYCHVVSLGLVY